MKKRAHFIFLIFTVLFSCPLFAQQDWRLNLNDEWFNEVGVNGLKVGDRMPDISLGKVLNNSTGKKKFSDFRGKLVILDFWNISCATCIAKFPEMERLQQIFGDQIQIITVNIFETEDQIKKDGRRMYNGKFQLPNLPAIVADKEIQDGTRENMLKFPLYKLFPNRGVPHHVWIGPDGYIRLIGPSPNTNEEKIRSFLAGNKISQLNSSSNVPSSKKSNSYYQLLGNFENNPIVFGSYFTRFNNEILGGYGTDIQLGRIDSTAKAIHNRMLNCDIFTLYNEGVFRHEITLPQAVSALATPGQGWYQEIPKEIDSAIVYASSMQKTDAGLMKYRYCYEQIVPLATSEQQQRLERLDDFNRFFSKELGLQAHIVTRKIPCYLLVRISQKDKLQAPEGSKAPNPLLVSNREINVKGKRMYKWDGVGFWFGLSVLTNASTTLKEYLLQNKEQGKPWLLLNETGLGPNKKVNIVLPHQDDLKTIEDLRKTLQVYDLDIIESDRELKFAVFSKVKEQKTATK